MAKIPDDLTDEQVVLLADIASTGFSGAESGGIRIGDSVVVFAQGPIGLCATAGARMLGASLVIGVDGDDHRLAMSKRMGADVVLDYRQVDVVEEVKKLTGGGVDVAIEALGTQQTLLTHTFPLDRIAEAYSVFGERRDGVLKVAIRP